MEEATIPWPRALDYTEKRKQVKMKHLLCFWTVNATWLLVSSSCCHNLPTTPQCAPATEFMPTVKCVTPWGVLVVWTHTLKLWTQNPFRPRVALVRYFVTVARRVTHINSVDVIKNYLALPPDVLKCQYPYRLFLFSCDACACKGLGFMLFKGTDVLKPQALLNSRCLI